MLNATSDAIEKDVNEVANDLFESNHDVKVAFVHYLSGPANDPYRLRRSAVRVRSGTWLESLAKANGGDNAQDSHDVVLKTYIRDIEREHTFLRFLVDEQKRLLCNSLVLTLNIPQTKADTPSYQLQKTVQGSQQDRILECSLDPVAARIVIPKVSVQKIFRDLYENRKVKEDDLRHLNLAKAAHFGQWIAEIQRSSSPPQDLIPDKAPDIWDTIAAFQSALLYFRAIYDPEDARWDVGQFSCCAVLVRDLTGNPNISLGVAICAPALTTAEQLLVRQRLQHLANHPPVANRACRALTEINAALKYNNRQGQAKDRFYRSIQTAAETFSSMHVYAENGHIYSQWLLLLTQYLFGRVHEGKLLEFFLVCGEKSEFEDCKAIRYRALDDGESDGLAIPENTLTFIANRIASLLASEHYPWFQHGRYALLWNIASQESKPTGLISIIQSSWRQVIEDRLSGKAKIQIPNCVICFVTGDPQSAGMMTVRDGKAREIVRWRNDEWESTAGNERKASLLKCLRQALNPNEDSLNNSVDIAIRVADDPEKGGTIIFVDDKQSQSFKVAEMGIPWRFKEATERDDDDIVALIAHDGATVRRLDQNLWQHRCWLTGNDETLETLDKLHEAAGEDKWPLASKGSRRWSGAAVALHSAVKAVVIISVDGDIQVWQSQRVETLLKVVQLTNIPLRDSSQSLRFVHDNGKWHLDANPA